MPRDVVWRGSLAPQRRKQDGLQDRTIWAKFSRFLKGLDGAFGLWGQMSLVTGLGAQGHWETAARRRTKGRTLPLFGAGTSSCLGDQFLLFLSSSSPKFELPFL